MKNYKKEIMNKKEIFNDGNPGIVEVNIVTINRKNSSYRAIFFEDSKGRRLMHPINYVFEDDDYEKKLRAQGIKLRHFWEAVVGDIKDIPAFEDTKEMLDTVVHKVYVAGMKEKFRIVVDYGYPPFQKKGLVLKKFTPFIEKADKKESILREDSKSYKEPLIE